MTAPAPARSLAILGSCVGRDSAAVLQERGWRVARYVARQSIISTGNAVDVRAIDADALESAFARRCFASDAAGDAEAQLAGLAATTDVLLWDLTDERLGVIEASPGHWLTRSTEGLTASLRLGRDFYGPLGGRLVELGTDEHQELFAAALPRLGAMLERVGLLERTILLQAPWAARTAQGRSTVRSWGMSALGANWAMIDYYERAHELGTRVLQVPDELVVADDAHRWGAAPFHYIGAFYDWVADGVEAFAARG
ncbi:hypothetical protein CHIBA101_1696 [Actinomyces sp. Chiba101]|uniref:DUF6270 domain-containing protein n=1 Tax=Actinomyces TaxID=1654 RepID=UPI000974DF51|nr:MULTISPECIES: DUF6270 domain-containing protein [Actinomyces]BAW93534.1 hypothetical protein CHIBA101_1696 [Actinomyces sp. Chiba101]SUU02803.1 Uncharacterised protein [Actinomyces denticolens]